MFFLFLEMFQIKAVNLSETFHELILILVFFSRFACSPFGVL